MYVSEKSKNIQHGIWLKNLKQSQESLLSTKEQCGHTEAKILVWYKTQPDERGIKHSKILIQEYSGSSLRSTLPISQPCSHPAEVSNDQDILCQDSVCQCQKLCSGFDYFYPAKTTYCTSLIIKEFPYFNQILRAKYLSYSRHLKKAETGIDTMC